MTAAPPALPAKIHPLVRAYLDTPGAVADTVRRFGSPVHLLFPQVFAENLGRFRALLEQRLPGHRICYAHKVNQSQAFVRTAERAGIAVDVASPQELASAAGAGFGPMRIEVTGPKGEVFLRDLIARGVTINVDNLWELRRIVELTEPHAAVPVLLRVSGFHDAQVSRFGVPLSAVAAAFELLCAHQDRITFLGFAFHLDSGDAGERVRAIDACLSLIEESYARGLTPSVVDIGGGFRQVFTADADRFDEYVQALRDALLGLRAPMSWGNNTFGYHVANGAVHGIPVFHKYANTVPATALLEDVLGAALERHGGRTVAEVLSDNLLDMWLEPGKALADHAGVTVAEVEFVKEIADGSVLVHVDLSRDCVTPADQEVMVDPVILPGDGRTITESAPAGVYFAGRLCLERDLITNHLVWPADRPRPGDLVVFPNTAAYHMDLSAASASMHPRPSKLVVTYDDNDFRVCHDAEYQPAPTHHTPPLTSRPPSAPRHSTEAR